MWLTTVLKTFMGELMPSVPISASIWQEFYVVRSDGGTCDIRDLKLLRSGKEKWGQGVGWVGRGG